MPVYLYWGEDEYRLGRAVQSLRDRILDPNWISFNYDKIAAEQAEAVIQGLNQAVTPPFGGGGRLVWLVNSALCHRCSEDLLAELERTLPQIPANAHLLLTSQSKPDGRSKSVKLLQKHAQIKEFSPTAPWKTEQLIQDVKQAAQQQGVRLTPDAVEQLTEAVGNNGRQLLMELEKLSLYAATQGASQPRPLDAQAVAMLVGVTTHNSLQLADAIRRGETAQALALVAELINQNEPPLRIVATLTKQLRTWLWVKVMVEAGEQDERAIAQAAQVNNPKRIYFLRQEVRNLTLPQLQQTLPCLLDLEVNLKQGVEPTSALHSAVIALSQSCQSCQPKQTVVR